MPCMSMSLHLKHFMTAVLLALFAGYAADRHDLCHTGGKAARTHSAYLSCVIWFCCCSADEAHTSRRACSGKLGRTPVRQS
jgi:hypothetical protein